MEYHYVRLITNIENNGFCDLNNQTIVLGNYTFMDIPLFGSIRIQDPTNNR